jgi:hypothetical protein
MNLHNPYEAEFLGKDRAKHVEHQVKHMRGPAGEGGKDRGTWVTALIAIFALLPVGVILSAVTSINSGL